MLVFKVENSTLLAQVCQTPHVNVAKKFYSSGPFFSGLHLFLLLFNEIPLQWLANSGERQKERGERVDSNEEKIWIDRLMES